MRSAKLSIMFLLLSAGISSAVVVDNSEQLYVPPGETYTLSGMHSYNSSVVIEGMLYVDAYTGAEGTGTLELICPNISIAGQILGVGSGYRGRSNYQEGPGIGGYPGGGAGYGGNGGMSGQGGRGGPAYGTATGTDIQMGSGGGDTGGALYGGGDGGAMVTLRATTLSISGTGAIVVDGTAGLDTTWGAGGASGGGILIRALNVTIAGSLYANGGRGGNGSWGGGGGAGGRIKIFYGTLNTAGTVFSYAGGAGGLGSWGGNYGENGTYYAEQIIFDDADYLFVPPGLTYQMSGTHHYRVSAVIVGLVDVTPYDGSVDSGQLTIVSPIITVSGKINGDERGYRGTGNYQEGPGCGGYPSGGAGYGGRGGDSASGGTGTGPYGTAQHIDIDMGSGGGDTGGGIYGGGNGGAKIVLNADSLTIDYDGLITVGGGAGLNTTWGAGGASGGGIMLLADSAVIRGTLLADGGAGGSGTWGGGGGAGGRIKIFYNVLDITGGTGSYSGGAGGGGSWPGMAGDMGTLFMGRNMKVDLNHDGTVNFLDMAILADSWLQSV
jgi:hypothetical protein